jgi:hypothetical protein
MQIRCRLRDLAIILRRRPGSSNLYRRQEIPTTALLVVVVVTGAWTLYFAGSTIVAPYPLEFREGAAPALTQFLLEGENPYALQNQPPGLNQYGIVYNAIVWPLAALFGNSLVVHRSVTFAFIALTAVLVGRIIFASNKQAVVAAGCGLLTAMALTTRGGAGAFPSPTGTFLFMAALIIPFRRSFDSVGLLLSTLLSLVAFYTKVYFVLGLGLVIAYTFLFISKRRALLHAFLSASGFLISFFLIRHFFPLYFVDVLVSSYLDVGASSAHMWRQLINLGREFSPIAILALSILVAAAIRSQWRLSRTTAAISRADIRHLDGPLLRPRLDYFGFVFVCAALAFIVVLGANTGQFMTYGYQLMVPPFLVWLGFRVLPQGRWRWIMAPAIALNLITFSFVRLAPTYLAQPSAEDWEQLYGVIDHSAHILASPVAAAEMSRQGKWPLDSGHSEYYYIIDARYAALRGRLGPDYETVHANGREFLEAIRVAIRRQEYDAIILPLRYEISMDDIVGGHYSEALNLGLAMPQTQEYWPVTVWVPSSAK